MEQTKFSVKQLDDAARNILKLQDAGMWDSHKGALAVMWEDGLLDAAIAHIPAVLAKIEKQEKIDNFLANVNAFEREVKPLLQERARLASQMRPFTERMRPIEARIAELRKELDVIRASMKPLNDKDAELAKQQSAIQEKWGGWAKLEDGQFKAGPFGSGNGGGGTGVPRGATYIVLNGEDEVFRGGLSEIGRHYGLKSQETGRDVFKREYVKAKMQAKGLTVQEAAE